MKHRFEYYKLDIANVGPDFPDYASLHIYNSFIMGSSNEVQKVLI